MSGGSYNYLCLKDAQELIEAQSDINEMFERLVGLGYAEDAARETLELMQIIRQASIRIDVISNRLEPVWHAVEWWDSGDTGEDGVKKALEKYRNNLPA